MKISTLAQSLFPIYREDFSRSALIALRAVRPYSRTSLRLCGQLFDLGLRPGHVIDAGANIGQFAASALYTFPSARVDSFEPLPDAISSLKQLAHRQPRLHVYPVALGASSGTATLHVNAHSHSSSLRSLTSQHLRAFPHALEHGTVECRIGTLDDVYYDRDFSSDSVLLKLDVQGAESDVLKGGQRTLRQVSHIMCEAAVVELYEGELTLPHLVELMDTLGFEPTAVLDILHGEGSRAPVQADLLFTRRDTASWLSSENDELGTTADE